MGHTGAGLGYVAERNRIGIPVLEELYDIPSRSIARRLHEEHPELWQTLEAARGWVRAHRGNKGNGKRHLATHPRENQPAGWAQRLPPSVEDLQDTTPYEIAANRVLVMGDVHIPYHNHAALSVTLDYAAERDIDAIVLNGDIIDNYALSRYTTDPTRRDVNNELELTRAFLGELRSEWPSIPIVYHAGNHEERWEAYLYTAGSRLAGISAFRFDEVLRLGELRIPYLDRLRRVKIGKLNVVHGHEFGQSAYSPVNAARGLYLRAKTTALCGHWHQTSSHDERSLDGKFVTTWSHGCLCELQPYYRPYNRWNHGFAVVEITDDEGNFATANHRIIKNVVY